MWTTSKSSSRRALMVLREADGSGAMAAIDPLEAAGTEFPSGVTARVGRRSVAGSEDPGVDPDSAQSPPETNGPTLDATRKGEAVGARESDPHAYEPTWCRTPPRGGEVWPRSLGQLGCALCKGVS